MPTTLRPGRSTFHVKHAAAALLLVFAAGCAATSRDVVTGERRGLGYTWQQQVQIGRESDPAILAQFGVYDERSLDTYVNEIGQRMVAVSHARRPEAAQEVQQTAFTFRVLDSPVVNAFALPGGYIYVTRGLMAHLENEAQLAVVLGHEIAHVTRQHAARQAFEAQRAQLGLLAGVLAGSIIGGPAGQVANVLGQYGGTGLQLMMLKYSRGDEREADEYGVEYATLAGYEAAEGADFFTSLKRISQQSNSGTLPEWLSSHPDPGNREVRIRELAAQWDARTPQPADRIEEAGYKARLDGIVFDENPRQGFVEGNVFYHPELRFQYTVPQGFQVQNDAARVVMGNQQGQAIMMLTLSQQSTAAAAAQATARQQGVRVLDSGTDTVNGLRAAYLVADVQSQQGTIRLANYFIEHGGRVYDLAGLTSQQGFTTFQNTFATFFRSFRPLTDSRILNVQPVRLDVQAAARTAPFRAFLPSNLPRGVTVEELAIANQTTLDATIQAGKRIKTVR
jgi:predicted Zn-dependent protease